MPESEADKVLLHRETVEIEGGRKLYSYTFEIGLEKPVEEQVRPDAERETGPSGSA